MPTEHSTALALPAPVRGGGLAAVPAIPAAMDAVPRPALVAELSRSRAPLTLIVAPPGYGKSTLLAQWAAADERPFAWLGADPSDSASGVRIIGPGGLCSAIGLLGVIRCLRARHDRFVVVLDNADRAAPATLRDAVIPAIEELPPGATIALAARTDPALPLGRWRVQRRLAELRAPQLAMTVPEAAQMLDEAAIVSDSQSIERLVHRTEGWPAALYLATLASREDPDGLDDFSGEHHLVGDYVRDEILNALPDDLGGFAVASSILDELTAPVCDAVLGPAGAAHRLQQLARATALLIPLDSSQRSFRWHRLAREALLAELRCGEPRLEEALRSRASRWHAETGQLEQAIEQASRAHDAELTATLLWRGLGGYATSGRTGVVAGWLSRFDAERIAASPRLAVSAAIVELLDGDVEAAEHWWQAATGSGADARAAGTMAGELIAAVSAREGAAGMRDAAIAAIQREGPLSEWRALGLMLAGVATHLLGDRTQAQELLSESIGHSVTRAPTVAALALAQRAMLAIEQPDWELATELTDRAAQVVAEWRLEEEPLTALVFAAAAACRAHTGRADEAKHDLRHGTAQLARMGPFVPWYGAETRILLAHAALGLADVVGARGLLAEASRLARRIPDAVIFPAWFDQAWEHIDSLAESSLAGPSSLTIAELRVLRFLPTHRSFREIAQQLGVSTNTVKTQAHAVYRKLDAASRSEAIAHAEQAGLLGV